MPWSRPRPRFTRKARADQHGRPIPSSLLETARLCEHVPCVVKPVFEGAVHPVQSLAKFEQEYGNLLRSTPQYHGLQRTALKSALDKRQAVDLKTRRWVADPIRVSDRVLRSWLEQYRIPSGRDPLALQVLQGRVPPSVTTPEELEDFYGFYVRGHFALGFTGRRAAERYLSDCGIRVGPNLVRSWYDMYGSRGPFWDLEDPTSLPGVVLSLDDLRVTYDLDLRIWRDVEGLSVQQASAAFCGS